MTSHGSAWGGWQEPFQPAKKSAASRQIGRILWRASEWTVPDWQFFFTALTLPSPVPFFSASHFLIMQASLTSAANTSLGETFRLSFFCPYKRVPATVLTLFGKACRKLQTSTTSRSDEVCAEEDPREKTQSLLHQSLRSLGDTMPYEDTSARIQTR